MTTVAQRPDKRAQLVKALESIHKVEPRLQKYAKIVVINEYSPNFKATFLKRQFPWIDQIVDKTKKDRGQAGSLNIAINMLYEGKFDYWLHWEESWIATKPFLKICDEAMKLGIDQIQLTEDNWEEDHDYRIRLPENKRYIYVQSKYLPYSGFAACARNTIYTPKIKKKTGKIFVNQNEDCVDHGEEEWPLWSLRPGMDRASKVLNVGYFNTNPNFWPVDFELEWAWNWTMQPGGVVKAGIICAKRQKGHQSFSESNF